MTKQEKIRKGMEQTIRDSYKELQALNKLDPVTHNIDKAIRVVLFEQSTKAVARLHSQDVVIKVDKQLYDIGIEYYNENVAKMLKAGYVATEPLIEGSWDYITRNAYHCENIEPLV